MTATQPEAFLPETFLIDRLETPIGPILIAVDAEGRLSALDFFADDTGMRRMLRRQYGKVEARAGEAPAAIRDAFARYFGGDIQALAGLPVRTGGTAFQRKVWQALRSIPVGETRSYGQLAAQIGTPNAVRAVGLANGANPVGIAIPCHRVIGADGSLTGFGGGLPRKRWLLSHEGAAFRERGRSGRLQPELELGQPRV
jgi:methylated-DNA-[protein]-cysteine S-methyltransferase